jgi:two-component system chemotaxis response regulator CheY
MHKILVVDDEQDILETVSDLIETKFSCGVDKATNGLDAFLMCMKEKFDLIITDHKMPFMTGAAFIIATRTKENKNKATPIIMLSGFIDEDMRKNLGIQNVQFLTKPSQPNTLFNTVRDHLL